jgi:uncharacterized RDD family membrane protein YckC
MPVAGALHDFPLTDVVNAVRFSVGRLVFTRLPHFGQFELDLQEGSIRACRVGPDHERVNELAKVVDKLVLVNLLRAGDFAFNPTAPPSLEQICNFNLDAVLLEVVSRTDEIKGAVHLFAPSAQKFRRTMVEASELDRDLRGFLRQTSAMLRREASADEIALALSIAVQQAQLYLLKLTEFGLTEPAEPVEAFGHGTDSALDHPLPDAAAQGPAKWFYLERDQEIGPVAEEIILHRISTGQMASTAMVWRAGLSRWTAYEDVHAADLAEAAKRGPRRNTSTVRVARRFGDERGDLQRCHVCMNYFPHESMMYYQERWICENCRPDFFKNLSQLGVHFRAVRRAVAKLPRRFFAWLFDVLLFVLLAKSIWIGLANAGVIEPGYFLGPKYLGAELAAAIVWWTMFVWIGGTTPGKWALHLRVVTSAHDERAGFLAAFKRAVAAFIPFGFMVALFNPERRTLSDFLAGTRVIRWVMET